MLCLYILTRIAYILLFWWNLSCKSYSRNYKKLQNTVIRPSYYITENMIVLKLYASQVYVSIHSVETVK